jgi:hypothetical protein
VGRVWPSAAACAGVLLFGVGLLTTTAPDVQADACASVGGAHVDVSGCADPFSYLNDPLAPPPPPPPPDAAPPPPPPPPAPNVSVCASAGRRVTVSGCV